MMTATNIQYDVANRVQDPPPVASGKQCALLLGGNRIGLICDIGQSGAPQGPSSIS